ncbi:TerD family protein [Streptomyces sp. NPDC051567]|uniref:TerD family protein n=1 Tax=Streptomyces sp. NPDC051567 TaxID=3365660 RepID=UPI0037912533
MTGVRKSLAKVEVALRWDPSGFGAPANDLDLVVAVYGTADRYGEPAYVVHFGSRSPDGTVTLNRDSHTGQGFGYDEVVTIELDRMAPALGRVVVGVVIQDPGQDSGAGGALTKNFAGVSGAGVRIREGYTELAQHGFEAIPAATAATVAEFTRDTEGGWSFHAELRGFDADPQEFTRTMGAAR